MLLVALFKLASPAAPSWAVVVVSLLSGEALSLLVVFATAPTLTRQNIATAAVAGIFAAAAAAGVRGADNAADKKRDPVQP
jgi:siroheme synthase